MLLGAGTYRVPPGGLVFDARDGGREGAPVVYAAAAAPGGGEARISGAALLDLDWQPAADARAPGVFVADLPADTPPFSSLFIAGERYWYDRTTTILG